MEQVSCGTGTSQVYIIQFHRSLRVSMILFVFFLVCFICLLDIIRSSSDSRVLSWDRLSVKIFYVCISVGLTINWYTFLWPILINIGGRQLIFVAKITAKVEIFVSNSWITPSKTLCFKAICRFYSRGKQITNTRKKYLL